MPLIFPFITRTMQNIPITTRLLVLGAPSLLGMACLSFVILSNLAEGAVKLDKVACVAHLAGQVGTLAHEMQIERDAVGISLVNRGARFRDDVLAQQQTTAALREKLHMHACGQPRSQAARTAVEKVLASKSYEVTMTRDGVGAPVSDLEGSYQHYSSNIANLFEFVIQQGLDLEEANATRSFSALFNLMQAAERAAQERTSGGQALAVDGFQQASLDRFKRLRFQQAGLLYQFSIVATQAQKDVLASASTPEDLLNRLRHRLEGTASGGMPALDADEWYVASTVRVDLLRGVEAKIAADLEARASAAASDARMWFATMLVLIVAALASMAFGALSVGRSLSIPLLRMTRAMTSLAQGNHEPMAPGPDRLDEVGMLAAAFEVFRFNAVMRLESDARIAHLSRHDALTDLPNRAAFQERVADALRGEGGGIAAGILSIDIDGFQSLNDCHGHEAGDLVLRCVAERLQSCMGDTDSLSRVGGDEFAVVRSGLQGAEDARTLVLRILRDVSEPIALQGHRFIPQLSIGISLSSTDGVDVDRLIKNADVALHRVKAEGGNGYRFFRQEMEASLQARRQLEADLMLGLEREEFYVVYQPQVDARSLRVTGLEALVRWRHPDRGVIPPDDFISSAEETGLINALGEWVLRKACLDAASWPEKLSVAVNFSPIQFQDDRLIEKIGDALAFAGLPPAQLELEITETVLLGDQVRILRMLQELQSMGVRIALDDFGTGYSSLSYLRSFPFNKLKIDRSFIQALGLSDEADVIVRAITMLGRNLGLAVTAEGVETQHQYERLKSNCTQLQGYLFGRPMSSADAHRLVASAADANGPTTSGQVRLMCA